MWMCNLMEVNMYRKKNNTHDVLFHIHNTVKHANQGAANAMQLEMNGNIRRPSVHWPAKSKLTIDCAKLSTIFDTAIALQPCVLSDDSNENIYIGFHTNKLYFRKSALC